MASLSINADDATQDGLDVLYSETVEVAGGVEPVYEIHVQTVSDGDRAWRTNNPANLQVKSGGGLYNGQVGEHTVAGATLAVFKTMSAGETAAYANIFDNDHSSMTVEERVKAWPGLTGQAAEDYWDAAKQEIDSALWDDLMSTITSAGDKEEVYNGILRAENGWINGSPSGSDIGTVSDVEIVHTPLVLDLNGDGVQTIGIEEGVKFDFEGNGNRELTGWADSNDGFLALDLNGNGKIDDGTELFGNFTVVNGEVPGDAYRALRLYDENNDNIIDDRDSIFEELLIWVDANSNGKSSRKELMSLSELEIASISLENVLDVEVQNRNFLVKRGSFTLENGESRSMDDVHFDAENTYQDGSISLVGIHPDSDVYIV